jgi:membrane-associated phospholipid phosphatase
MRKFSVVVLATLSALPVHAQTGLLDRPTARFFSSEGNVAFLLAGTLVKAPRARAGAVVTSTLLVTSLKYLTKERRPDGTTHDSFPSGHAMTAFTVAGLAAAQARTKTEAGLWYLGAALISDSRVTLKRHYPHDVLVGGLLGLLVARTPSLQLRF